MGLREFVQNCLPLKRRAPLIKPHGPSNEESSLTSIVVLLHWLARIRWQLPCSGKVTWQYSRKARYLLTPSQSSKACARNRQEPKISPEVTTRCFKGQSILPFKTIQNGELFH